MAPGVSSIQAQHLATLLDFTIAKHRCISLHPDGNQPCTSCTTGKAASSETADCTACAAGKYQESDPEPAYSCKSCGTGKYGDATEQILGRDKRF